MFEADKGLCSQGALLYSVCAALHERDRRKAKAQGDRDTLAIVVECHKDVKKQQI